MNYEVTVVDVHGDYHTDANGVPTKAATPIAAFHRVLEWCRDENVMPETITVSPPWKGGAA